MTKPRADRLASGAQAERRSLTSQEEAKNLDQARERAIQTGQSQTVWVTIARNQYELFKKELADLGNIEVESFTPDPKNDAVAKSSDQTSDQSNDSPSAGFRESSTFPAFKPLDSWHGSGRAELPHPALALGNNAKAHQRMRMITPLTPSPADCLTYPLKRAGHVFPALCPGHVTLKRLPLGQSPFLHCLRSRTGGFVRQLRRYYETVRLPMPVHHRCASLDFPMRSGIPSLADRHGISRLPLKVLACMLRVSDRAGPKASRDSDASSLAFRLVQQRRHPGVAIACAMVVQFRGSIPGLHAPLSTLHPRPCGRTYMTRSQCGSLLLHCPRTVLSQCKVAHLIRSP